MKKNTNMHAGSGARPKQSKGLGNQHKLMHGITAPLRSEQNAKKPTKKAPAKTQPKPEPVIRILKRPSHLARGQVEGGSHTKPLKGLEQRRKEYEEARLRILGEARNPEDDDVDREVEIDTYMNVVCNYFDNLEVNNLRWNSTDAEPEPSTSNATQRTRRKRPDRQLYQVRPRNPPPQQPPQQNSWESAGTSNGTRHGSVNTLDTDDEADEM